MMQERGGGNVNWASCQVGSVWNEHERFVSAVYILVSVFSLQHTLVPIASTTLNKSTGYNSSVPHIKEE